MLRILRSRLLFIIIALAASLVPVRDMLRLWQADTESTLAGWHSALCVGAALLCLLLLWGGVLYARKRGVPALLSAGRLWGLALLAIICAREGDLYTHLGQQPMLPIILTTAAGLCLLWAVFRWGALLFWWPFLILEMAQIAGYHEYGARINSLVLAETFEASDDEVMTYLSSGNLTVAITAILVSSVLCALMLWLLRRQRSLTLLNTGLLGLSIAAAAATIQPGRLREPQYYWPAGEAYLLQQACTEALFHNHATIKQVEQLPSPTLQPSSLPTLKGGEGVALIVHIGESVRADRMSINGYERDTTPWLRTQPRLINFPSCISAACDTCQAQITILTDGRRDIYETTPALQPHTGSVLDLFAAHGFKIYSFFGKRNATHLKYDRVVRLLTRCATERFHAPGSPWTSVPQIEDTLRALGDKQNSLIFINNEGSHTPFRHYDHEHPPFTPLEGHFHDPAAHAQEINNAYDATVHYTDEFVRRVTHLLQGRPWIYLYISDHGEYLGHDGIWGRAGLGESQRDYHSTTGCRVGMFILTSSEFEQLHPHFATALQNLQQHSSMTIAHEHIFHTLLGLFDLHTPHYDSTLDLTSPTARPYSGPQPTGNISH